MAAEGGGHALYQFGASLRHFQFQLQVTYTLLRNRTDTQRVVSCDGNLLTDGLQIARQGDYGCTVRTALAIRGIDPCCPSGK